MDSINQKGMISMSEEQKQNSTACDGDCGSCSSSCEGGNVDLSSPTITLTLDDDTELKCEVLRIFTCGENQYIALLPLDENDEIANGDVYLYRFFTDEKNNPFLENIEDADEYNAAANYFNESMELLGM